MILWWCGVGFFSGGGESKSSLSGGSASGSAASAGHASGGSGGVSNTGGGGGSSGSGGGAASSNAGSLLSVTILDPQKSFKSFQKNQIVTVVKRALGPIVQSYHTSNGPYMILAIELPLTTIRAISAAYYSGSTHPHLESNKHKALADCLLRQITSFAKDEKTVSKTIKLVFVYSISTRLPSPAPASVIRSASLSYPLISFRSTVLSVAVVVVVVWCSRACIRCRHDPIKFKINKSQTTKADIFNCLFFVCSQLTRCVFAVALMCGTFLFKFYCFFRMFFPATFWFYRPFDFLFKLSTDMIISCFLTHDVPNAACVGGECVIRRNICLLIINRKKKFTKKRINE